MPHAGFSHESHYNESIEWYTPPVIFDALGLSFELDPASPGPAGVPWIPVSEHLTVNEDGLKVSWAGKRVWLNPPYGDNTKEWMKKFIEEQCTGCMLVFARTDTKWFHEYAIQADALCFVKGRIKFIRGDGFVGSGCGAASLLIAKGQGCVDALRNSRLGFVCKGIYDE